MDQIANMINMIKNAGIVGHESIVIPYSHVKQAILECLVKEGYVASVSKKMKKSIPVLEVGISYKDGLPKVKGAERISKLSSRVYKGVKDIKPTRNGYGLMILTTPKGILTDKEARKEMVGGEALFKIW